MTTLFSSQDFSDFGPHALDPQGGAGGTAPLFRIQGESLRELRTRVRQCCPARSGVYGMLDAQGTLVYVGKARRLRVRLLGYFHRRRGRAKERRILSGTRGIVWEKSPSEFAALLRELELIRRWQPRFNVRGRSQGRRHTYVCLGRAPAPYVYLAPRPARTAQAVFGPVPAGRHAREAVRRLNDGFRLRDCPQRQEMRFADQDELFPLPVAAGCLRHEIGTCLGPCTGLCAPSAYQGQVRAAEAFLRGTDLSLLETLEREMAAASAGLAFERAVTLRDGLNVLRWLREQCDALRLAQERYSFVYPVSGHDGEVIWYLVHRGRVSAAAREPGRNADRQATAALIERIYFDRALPPAPPPAGAVDQLLLVVSWFRQHPAERTLEPAEALRRCRIGDP
jgi:excinuclease ABC subunit C